MSCLRSSLDSGRSNGIAGTTREDEEWRDEVAETFMFFWMEMSGCLIKN
mgnify:CR=1 FL=1